MTDVPGRRARWTGALVIAPGAAAVFAAAVSWAAQSTPTTATTPVASTPQPPSVAGSASAPTAALARELRRTIAARHHRATELSNHLAALNKQLATIRAMNRRAAQQSAGTVTNPGPVVTYQPSQQQPVQQQAPAPVYQQAPAPVYQQAPAPPPPPPPVQTVTGASGKP